MADKSRETANLVSTNNIYSDISSDKVGIGTTNATSELTVFGDVSIAGVVTASGFVGNVTGTASTASFATTSFGLSGTPNITVNDISSGNINSTGIVTSTSAVIGSNVSLNSTGVRITGVGTVTSSFNVGTALTSGSVIVGSAVTINSTGVNVTGFTTTTSLDIRAASETVSIASTLDLGGGKFILECNAQNGTIFTYTIPTAGNIGIVSFKNFPATKNSATTFTLFVTQNSAGTGNTTAVTGVGTNVILWPTGATAGLTTSSRVSAGSTITLPNVGGDINILTFIVHYNGSGAATTSNYTIYLDNNPSFRIGNIRP